MTRYAVAALSAVLLLLAGCGGAPDRATDPSPTLAAGDPAAPVSVVAEEDADLHLWVSNQSFVDDPVDVTVTIDDVAVVDRALAVEGQHNWQLFPVALEPGEHTLRAESGTGALLEETFLVPEGAVRYAVVDYWNYEDGEGRHFSWLFQRRPVAFM